MSLTMFMDDGTEARRQQVNEKAVIPQERIDELIAQMSNSDDFCFEGDFQDCAKILVQQEAKVAALQAEVAALKKENFILDDVSTQQAERIAELKAEVARLSAPVSHEEWNGIWYTSARDFADKLILLRATPPQDVENGGKQ